MTRADGTTIKGKFSSLKRNIRDALQEKIEAEENETEKELILNNIKMHLEDVFDNDCITRTIEKACTIHEVFDLLTKHKVWDYSNTDELLDVAREFLLDNEEIIEKIEEYKNNLLGHNKCILICDWMTPKKPNVNILALDPIAYQGCIKKNCRWKFFESEIILNQCLNYLEEVWKKLLLNYGDLHLVLDQIRDGCIEIVWYVSSSAAQSLIMNIKEAVPILQEAHISEVYLEDEKIFDCTSGIANELVGFTISIIFNSNLFFNRNKMNFSCCLQFRIIVLRRSNNTLLVQVLTGLGLRYE